MPADNRIVYQITDEYALITRERSPFLYLEWREKGRPVRRSTGCSDLDGAKQRARDIILEEAKICEAKPESALITAVVDRYYLRYAKKLSSASTAKRAAKIWGEYFPATAVADLTPSEVRGFRTWMERRSYSQGYIRRILGVGQAAMNMAYDDRELTWVPRIKLPPIGAGYPYAAMFEQLVTFLNTPMPERLFRYCMIRLNTGCRGDAARDLQPFQLDRHARLVSLNPEGRTQTKKFRPIVPLTDFLAVYLPINPEAEYYVNWHGRKMKGVRRVWNKVRDDAGLPATFKPKILRHTVGKELRRRGVKGWDVSGQLGHTKGESAPTTENYAKFDPTYLAAAKQAFDDWMRELAAKVPRMRDATAMPLTAAESAETRTARALESRAVAGVHAAGSVVGGTGFEPVTPTMSR